MAVRRAGMCRPIMPYEYNIFIGNLNNNTDKKKCQGDIVGRSAHGIHLSGPGFGKYRDKCLELFGESYYQLPNLTNDHWHPFRLPRATDD